MYYFRLVDHDGDLLGYLRSVLSTIYMEYILEDRLKECRGQEYLWLTSWFSTPSIAFFVIVLFSIVN